ncbi:hypothetical protein F4775DRAFT_561579 [Biscogniauxia sp. FL1348]|nr:hypothetical protein F4775DRAFT_561579 [Biscogniauxia sp. FL1348]
MQMCQLTVVVLNGLLLFTCLTKGGDSGRRNIRYMLHTYTSICTYTYMYTYTYTYIYIYQVIMFIMTS